MWADFERFAPAERKQALGSTITVPLDEKWHVITS
jgi:hypothetical protein